MNKQIAAFTKGRGPRLKIDMYSVLWMKKQTVPVSRDDRKQTRERKKKKKKIGAIRWGSKAV